MIGTGKRHWKAYLRDNVPGYKDRERAIGATWLAKNKDRLKPILKATRKKWVKKQKDTCYFAYGGYICACCGEKEKLFLTFDHVHNDGAAHRKEIKGGGRGAHLWRWIIKNNFPKGMFQVLCANCNLGKSLNGGVCPHKKVVL